MTDRTDSPLYRRPLRLLEALSAWHARFWLHSAERTVTRLQRQIEDDHAAKLRAERQLANLKRRLAR